MRRGTLCGGILRSKGNMRKRVGDGKGTDLDIEIGRGLPQKLETLEDVMTLKTRSTVTVSSLTTPVGQSSAHFLTTTRQLSTLGIGIGSREGMTAGGIGQR